MSPGGRPGPGPGEGTIAAIATPRGRGGLGMLRISGPATRSVVAALFRSSKRDPTDHARATLGTVLDANGAPLDRGVLTFFRAPRSYTGEDTAEISIHGSPLLVDRLQQAALQAGAREAAPGEFTYRAFRNGRIDLAQAEAVADLVEARTAEAARVAFLQSEGSLGRALAPARAALVRVVALLEAGLEFSDEDGVQVDGDAIREGLAEVSEVLDPIASSHARGRLLTRVATAVLAGPPNAGKSSLFNRLVGEERAIVTPVPGTTRDLVAESVEIQGIPLRLTDTAGIAESTDPVEAEGVRRADRARREADVVLFVTDRSRPAAPGEAEALGASPPGTLLVRNKADLPESPEGLPPAAGRLEVVVSARTGLGVDRLRDAVAGMLGGNGDGSAVEAPLTRERQYRHVARALAAVRRAEAARSNAAGDELVLVDLQEARGALGAATGEVDLDEIYDEVFSTFCIGK